MPSRTRFIGSILDWFDSNRIRCFKTGSQLNRRACPEREIFRRPFVFKHLHFADFWFTPCFSKGMNPWLIVLALQVIVAVIALVRESGEDARFEGDKLGYRS
jgi:hypothetical protein